VAGVDLSHAVSGQFESMGVVDEPVEDGIGEGRVADDVVPGVDGQLACDDGGGAAVAVLEDFQQVTAFAGGECGKAPVVEDQQVGAGDNLQRSGVATVATGERQRFEEARDAVIEDAAPVPAGLLAEGAGKPAFSQACGACCRRLPQKCLLSGDLG
jgi:hypothetical protein